MEESGSNDWAANSNKSLLAVELLSLLLLLQEETLLVPLEEQEELVHAVQQEVQLLLPEMLDALEFALQDVFMDELEHAVQLAAKPLLLTL